MNSRLFTSLRPQLPRLGFGARCALDLGCGENTIFQEQHIAKTEFAADIKPAGCAVPIAACEGTLLPFRDGSFDLVISRVAVPYMNIPRAFREIHRILASGGCFWATLHPPRMAFRRIGRSIKKRDVADVIYQSYSLLNCFLLMIAPVQLPWFNGRFESVQATGGIERSLRHVGFAKIETEIREDEAGRRHFAVLAYKA